MDDRREERHDDAVEPCRARADRDQRVHVDGAVAGSAPRGAVEALPRPDLDQRRGAKREPVDGLHRDARLRNEHRDHDHDGDRDRGDRLDERRSRLPIALGVGAGERGGERRLGGRRLGRGPWAGPDVIAGRRDRLDQLGPTGDLRQVADRGDLGREVHVGALDAVRRAQEAFDPVDAGRAGHALDGKLDLGGGRC